LVSKTWTLKPLGKYANQEKALVVVVVVVVVVAVL
jgi:hypothetical protein